MKNLTIENHNLVHGITVLASFQGPITFRHFLNPPLKLESLTLTNFDRFNVFGRFSSVNSIRWDKLRKLYPKGYLTFLYTFEVSASLLTHLTVENLDHDEQAEVASSLAGTIRQSPSLEYLSLHGHLRIVDSSTFKHLNKKLKTLIVSVSLSDIAPQNMTICVDHFEAQRPLIKNLSITMFDENQAAFGKENFAIATGQIIKISNALPALKNLQVILATPFYRDTVDWVREQMLQS